MRLTELCPTKFVTGRFVKATLNNYLFIIDSVPTTVQNIVVDDEPACKSMLLKVFNLYDEYTDEIVGSLIRHKPVLSVVSRVSHVKLEAHSDVDTSTVIQSWEGDFITFSESEKGTILYNLCLNSPRYIELLESI